ncbi:MAG: hypothetical protein MZV49_19510 [Rhodopseudomonas palustris]|nr:hypothetical protein [Rhodopseudomonas palustris]
MAVWSDIISGRSSPTSISTRDVAETNHAGYDTRFWTRVIVPLWNPDAPTPQRPSITK